MFSGVFQSISLLSSTSVTETMYCIADHKSLKRPLFPLFNGKLRNGRPKYGHIRHQRIQINKNQRFVFRFSRILFLTVFRYFRRPYWIEGTNRFVNWFANP